MPMTESFFKILTQFPSANISFCQMRGDSGVPANTVPVYQGRHLMGTYVRIVAVIEGGVQVVHPTILLTRKIYAAIAATGSRTFD